MCAAAGISTISRISVKSSGHSGIPSLCCFQQLPRCSFPQLPRYFANLLGVMNNPAEAMARAGIR